MPKEIARKQARNKDGKQSTYLLTVGHDTKEMVLQVEYPSGAVWNYTPVTESEFNAMQNAESMGQHFIRHIRDIKQSEHVVFASKKASLARPSLQPVRQQAEKRVGLTNAGVSDFLKESSRFPSRMIH